VLAYTKKPGHVAGGWRNDPGNFDWFNVGSGYVWCSAEPNMPHRKVKYLQRTFRLTPEAAFNMGIARDVSFDSQVGKTFTDPQRLNEW